jgi:hypothetical protein
MLARNGAFARLRRKTLRLSDDPPIHSPEVASPHATQLHPAANQAA